MNFKTFLILSLALVPFVLSATNKVDGGDDVESVVNNNENENRVDDIVDNEEQVDKKDVNTDNEQPEKKKEESETNDNSEEAQNTDYKTGSVCNYCKYCKHCDESICEKNCPCKENDSKEICETCKYCKYCFVCGSICDTVCNPGGILDSITGSLYESLPSFTDKSKEDVDKDIEKAKNFIKEYL